jgi:hypothetical protein
VEGCLSSLGCEGGEAKQVIGIVEGSYGYSVSDSGMEGSGNSNGCVLLFLAFQAIIQLRFMFRFMRAERMVCRLTNLSQNGFQRNTLMKILVLCQRAGNGRKRIMR